MTEDEGTVSGREGTHSALAAAGGAEPTVLDLELQALAYEAALRYGARQVPKPLVEFLRPRG